MNKKQIEKEWIKLSRYLVENKPQTDRPYTPDIVKRRELLLLAQVHLSNIMDAKSKKERHKEKLEARLYCIIMEKYRNWDESA